MGLFVALKSSGPSLPPGSLSLSPCLFHSLSPSLSPLVLLPLSGRPNEAEGRRSARAHALVHYASRSLMLGKTKLSPLSAAHLGEVFAERRGWGGGRFGGQRWEKNIPDSCGSVRAPRPWP